MVILDGRGKEMSYVYTGVQMSMTRGDIKIGCWVILIANLLRNWFSNCFI